jgi:putative oxidoreductase
MGVGLLTLRIVVGAFFIGHGCQKLFGWFGGHGLPATGGAFVLIAVAFAVTAVGPGRYSVDHALGWDLAGLDWALIALGVGVVSALVVAAAARVTAPDAAGPARPAGA